MTPNEYQQLALRTASTRLGPEMEMMVRTLGLVGEVAELTYESDPVEMKLEAGDVLWYVATLADTACIKMDAVMAHMSWREWQDHNSAKYYDVSPEKTMPYLAGRIAERIKKHVGHGKDLQTVQFADDLMALMRSLVQMVDMYYLRLEDVAEENIAKLKARYPGGFDLTVSSKL